MVGGEQTSDRLTGQECSRFRAVEINCDVRRGSQFLMEGWCGSLITGKLKFLKL
jgi:hypothetical protein